VGAERVRSYTHQRECHNQYHCDLSQSQVCIPGLNRPSPPFTPRELYLNNNNNNNIGRRPDGCSTRVRRRVNNNNYFYHYYYHIFNVCGALITYYYHVCVYIYKYIHNRYSVPTSRGWRNIYIYRSHLPCRRWCKSINFHPFYIPMYYNKSLQYILYYGVTINDDSKTGIYKNIISLHIDIYVYIYIFKNKRVFDFRSNYFIIFYSNFFIAENRYAMCNRVAVRKMIRMFIGEKKKLYFTISNITDNNLISVKCVPKNINARVYLFLVFQSLPSTDFRSYFTIVLVLT